MTTRYLLGIASVVVALSACFEGHGLEVQTMTLDHLTSAQAAELSEPYLSKEGRVFLSKEVLNSITVRDHSRNVDRIRSMLRSRDASPSNVALHFQLIRATEVGEVGAGLEHMADALGELLRFKGYELMSEAVVSAAERGIVEQAVDGGGVPLQLGVRVADVRGYGNSGSVELNLELRRSGGTLLATNVVVPVGQTVVLGTAYPEANGSALILTVRGELGSQTMRATAYRRGGRAGRGVRGEPYVIDRVVPGSAVEAATTEIVVTPAEARSGRGAAAAARATWSPTPGASTPPPRTMTPQRVAPPVAPPPSR
jgi:hypothetical protein